MAKTYKGSLSLEWHNKQKSILSQSSETESFSSDVKAPLLNWVNKEESLFYEIDETEGKGVQPFWVDRNDIRIKEARPLIFQSQYVSISKDKKGTLPGIQSEYDVEVSKKEDASIENILIKGDNLLALNSLKKMFENKPPEEKIKCIYIDPPYNTLSSFSNYDDNLAHSEWLTMIRDRVEVLKELMRPDGLIFVHIDSNEFAHLKILLDEIFGRENYIDTIIVRGTPNARDYGHIAKQHEYVHAYAKDITVTTSNLLPDTEKTFDYEDEIGGFNVHPLYNSNVAFTDKNRPNLYYPFYLNTSNNLSENFYEIGLEAKKGWKEIYPPLSVKDKIQFVWRWGKELSLSELNKNIIGYKTTTNEFRIVQKMRKNEKLARSLWLDTEFSNRRGTDDLQKLFKKKVFAYPKPEYLLKRIFEIATNENDIILDCFGGSGTSFAVAHKMKRRWIGVELGNQADEIIIPRLNLVMSGKDAEGVTTLVGWQGGGSFKYYHLGPSIIKIGKDNTSDFNWKLGKKFLEESFLLSYDYSIDNTMDFSADKLFSDKVNQPLVGVQKIGSKNRVAIVSLNEPTGKLGNITYDELQSLYKTVKKKYSPEYINIFTNRGIEIAYDSKPEDLEVIKVPYAIFAELEK